VWYTTFERGVGIINAPKGYEDPISLNYKKNNKLSQIGIVIL
jgi:hypothetical protein